MAYYVFFYIFSGFLFFLNKLLKSNLYLYFLLFFAFLFSALRYDAGYDFFNYLDLIQNEENAGFQRLEFINKLIITYSRKFEFSQLYYIVTSFFYILFMALGFKQAKNFNVITISSMLFFIGSYLTAFDIIRQMVSVAIIFYATLLYINKKFFLVFYCFF